jgi:GAF domain-containing protein
MAVDEKLPVEKKALLKFALAVACELSGCDAGSIMIVEGGNLVIKSYLTSDPSVAPSSKIGISMKIGDRVAGRAAATGKPIVIDGDVGKDVRFTGIEKFRKINAGASIPIIFESKPEGVINISRNKMGGSIGEKEIDAVVTVAQELGRIL